MRGFFFLLLVCLFGWLVFFPKAEILTNDHSIIRLETIYKAEGRTLPTSVKTFEVCKFCVYGHFDLSCGFYYILKVVLWCFEGRGSCQCILNWGGAACQVTFPFCDMLSHIYSYIDINTHIHKMLAVTLSSARKIWFFSVFWLILVTSEKHHYLLKRHCCGFDYVFGSQVSDFHAMLLGFPSNRPDRGTSCFADVTTRKSKMWKTLGAQQWLTFSPTGYLSVHHKIWFCLCRPVRRHEVRSAAFKQGTGQMFQFPTWRTGSADAKGTKRLFGVVTTLRFPLPPPTLNLLPWSWTAWTGAVKLLCDQRAQSPQHVKAGRDFAADSAGPSLSPPGFVPGMKVGRSAHRSRDSPSALPGPERQRCVRRLLCYFLFQPSLWCTFNTFALSGVRNKVENTLSQQRAQPYSCNRICYYFCSSFWRKRENGRSIMSNACFILSCFLLFMKMFRNLGVLLVLNV